MVYEKILLLLFLIIFIIAIYYISKTCHKHNSILEKFSEEKILYKNVKFRDCQVYFTNDKEKCDEDYKSNNIACKYKFEGWKELAEITDGNDNVYKYADKVYVNNKLNENDYKNILEETRCFYKLGDEDDKTGDNITTIDREIYKYQDFYPFSMNNNICSISYPIKTEIKGKKFFEFVLDNNNNIINIKKVDILPEQNGFKIDSNFNIDKFIENYGNGLEYKSKNKFTIYQVSRFPDIDVKVYKFTYNYLCYNTQVMNYNITTTKINIGNIIDLSNNNVIVTPTDENGYIIDTDIIGIDWNNFRNSNQNIKEDKKQAIIDALVARKEVLEDELKSKNKKIEIELAKIKENIVDDGVVNKYRLTKYIDTNSGKWNQDKFLKQFNAFNYKRHYLTKSSDAIIDFANVEVSIRIKNNFKEGLKFFKVDGYYNDDINYIKNKNQIESIHQLEGKNIKNFKGLNNLTNGKQNKNSDDTYSMLFSGYFYAHETGNYNFGTTSNDASYIYINDNLVVDNGKTSNMRTVEKYYENIKKGDICKIDIYFAANRGNDNLGIFWRFNYSSRIYSSDWNDKTWFFYTEPDINPINNNSSIPTIKGNRQYVDGREHKLIYKTMNDNTGDIYYEFKNTDFIYDVIVKRDIDVKILIVGGGGGGGVFGGGGGGGSVLLKESKNLRTNDICTIKIGEGGNGAPIYNSGINGNNGKDSSIKINNQEYIAKGGGGGGSRKPYPYDGVNGNDGGSGGGGSHHDNGQTVGGGSNKITYEGWKSYGNIGGKGRNGFSGKVPKYASGGGGGAGYQGEDAVQSLRQYRYWPKDGGGGDGGIGINLSNHFGENVGDNGWFAGGGGGNTYYYGGKSVRNNGRKGYGNSYDGISDNKRKYGGGGDGGFDYKGGNGINGTGGGGGGGSNTYVLSGNAGSGGSGIVIIRIANSTINKLAKCNYYIPPVSKITPYYLEKSDVLESRIDFQVRNTANPKSLFYSSYIYLKKGYYKFNFDMDKSSYDDLFVKSKIIIYDNIEKTNFISVFKDNMITKKWVYIPTTNYYIIDISIVYISEGSYSIPFKIKARYSYEEKSNKLDFTNTELNINNYESVTYADKFKDMSYYIYYHDYNYLSGINNATDEYNINFNSFLESYYLLNNSFGYIINYFKLMGKRNNEIKSDRNIQKIDKLLEYLNNIDLRKYLDSSGESRLIENNLINNIFTYKIDNINDYITYNQYRQEDKDNLKGTDNNFNIFAHGPRSLFIEIF